MTGVDRSPTRTSGRVAVLAGIAAAVALATGSLPSLALGAPGVAVLAVGLRRGERSFVSVGGFGLFLAALLASVAGAPIPTTLVGAALAVLAWDAGTGAIELGEQVGRNAATRSAELAHLSGTVTVAAVAGGLAYGTYAATAGGRPMTALVLLTFGAVALASGLRLMPVSDGGR